MLRDTNWLIGWSHERILRIRRNMKEVDRSCGGPNESAAHLGRLLDTFGERKSLLHPEFFVNRSPISFGRLAACWAFTPKGDLFTDNHSVFTVDLLIIPVHEACASDRNRRTRAAGAYKRKRLFDRHLSFAYGKN